MSWLDVCTLHSGTTVTVNATGENRVVVETDIFPPIGSRTKTANVLLDNGRWYGYKDLLRKAG